MAIERRRIQAQNSVYQRLLPAQVTTTDATETVIYTSQVAISEGRRIYLRCTILVSLADASKTTSIIVEGTLRRPTGGSIVLVDSNFSRSSGDIKAMDATCTIKADTVTNKFQITVKGRAATTYQWTPMIDLLRNN